MQKIILFLAVFLLPALLPADAQENFAGSVKNVQVTAHVIRQGMQIRLEKDMKIYQLDTIVTGKDGSCGIILQDNTAFSMGSETKLALEEFEEVKKHPRYGYDTLVRAESRLINEGGHSFLRLASEIAYHHHEQWHGSGYPQDLAGTDILLSGRMVPLADVYDALISRRRYKPAFPHACLTFPDFS